MPSPLVHLAYGQQVAALRPELAMGPILRGTVFPDIRYLAGLDRRQTHRPYEISLRNLQQETNAWQLGWLLHNWVDDQWNIFFRDHFQLRPGSREDALTWASLKLLEDGLVRVRIKKPMTTVELLLVADPEALEFGVKPRVVERWGELLAIELNNGWMSESWGRFVSDGLGLSPRVIVRLRQRLVELQQDPKWQEGLEQSWALLNQKLKGAFA